MGSEGVRTTTRRSVFSTHSTGNWKESEARTELESPVSLAGKAATAERSARRACRDLCWIPSAFQLRTARLLPRPGSLVLNGVGVLVDPWLGEWF